jgi:GNAT superfamily N-acetyltransferase
MSDAGPILTAGIAIRPARAAEIPALERLIAASARGLSRGFYTEQEIEAAIVHVFGVDSDLVSDGTYFVAEEHGVTVGCGGWSRRRTLFGGDRFAARESGLLDPTVDAARIRAFFIAPGHARKGIGRALLAACEQAARAAGFGRAALMATLPGVPFYAAQGYRRDHAITQACGGVEVRFMPMDKNLLQK